jgi:hypothetical protein
MPEFEASLSSASSAAGRLSWTAPAAAVGKFATRLGLYLLLSSGLFYFTYKFYQPTGGGNDYFRYYPMYLRPLDLHASAQPWVYRQVSAVITNLIYRFGPYYHPQIAFSQAGYDQRVFFAALLTNYLALAACAAVAALAVERLRPGCGPAVPLFAGALCLLSFFAQANGMGPITDGVAWLLVAVGFVGYLNRSLVTLALVLLLAVVERELIPLMIGAIAAADLVISREQRRFDVTVIVLCVVAVLLYAAMRTTWAPVAGKAFQTQIGIGARSLTLWRQFFNGDVLSQGFLTQNLLILLGLSLVWRWWQRRRATPLPVDVRRLIAGLGAAAAVLVIVSYLAMIGHNIGRILGMLTPVTATLLALTLLPDERAQVVAPAG